MTVTARPAHGGEEVVGGGACGGVKDAMTFSVCTSIGHMC